MCRGNKLRSSFKTHPGLLPASPLQMMWRDSTSPAPAPASHRGGDIPLTLRGVAKPFATARENNRIDMQGLGFNSSRWIASVNTLPSRSRRGGSSCPESC